MGLFPPSALGGEEVAHGYKGKGVTTHLIADANGHPIDATATAANIDERKQVHPLLKKLKSWPLQGAILEADWGYTSSRLRKQIIHKGIYPAIRQRSKPKAGRTMGSSVRWKIERTFANLKRRYKRFGHRWEKTKKAWQAIVCLTLISYWVKILAG